MTAWSGSGSGSFRAARRSARALVPGAAEPYRAPAVEASLPKALVVFGVDTCTLHVDDKPVRPTRSPGPLPPAAPVKKSNRWLWTTVGVLFVFTCFVAYRVTDAASWFGSVFSRDCKQVGFDRNGSAIYIPRGCNNR